MATTPPTTPETLTMKTHEFLAEYAAAATELAYLLREFGAAGAKSAARIMALAPYEHPAFVAGMLDAFGC